MNKVKITTPENIEVEYVLAGLASRTAAAIIDTLIQIIIFIMLAAVLVAIRYKLTKLWYNYYGWIIGISLIIYTAITYGYFILMEIKMNGQTFGKRIYKLRTIRNNGQPITLKHSAIRNLFRVLIDSYGVGIVMMFFSKEHKRVGDLLASTIVVIEQNAVRPVTLDSIQKLNELSSYHISEKEKELLREYFERKAEMEDYTQLRENLKLHFTNKFEALGILDEWQQFINEL